MNKYFFCCLLFIILGCETIHQTTKQAGTYVGKGMKAAGGVSEGAVGGYMDGTTNKEENPYGR